VPKTLCVAAVPERTDGDERGVLRPARIGARTNGSATSGPSHPPRVHPIRVLIADDQPLMARAVASVLSTDPTIEVVGMAEDADGAVELAATYLPDVVLLDVRMRGGGPRAAAGIKDRSPRSAIVGFSAHEDRHSVFSMLRAGAVGYLVKGSSAEDITEAVHRAAAGQSALSVGVTADVIRELAGRLESDRRVFERRRRQFERIRRVLSTGGVRVVFQPVVDLRSGEAVGYEALARFPTGPERGPEEWFREADEVELRTELELTTVRSALARMDAFAPETFLAVNLSPGTACSEHLERAIDAASSPRRVVLEVTEHAPVRDYGVLNAAIGTLRARGVRLAVDDAGSGFASLQHILRLAPDFIKLDMALTRDVDNDLARRALAAALISFSAEIGATIIAEGIETEAELRTLRDLGVEYGQGFHLARPAELPENTGLAAS
jgi:EAL domain-containing protein (putative c-di-GMP-specific phosphodiesterase class I)/DNA-binding NarL/FixJ family response regulator